jgi:hypothetical protein
VHRSWAELKKFRINVSAEEMLNVFIHDGSC